MSRPFDRTSDLAPAGKPDESIGQRWFENPWKIVSEPVNLSAYERNTVYLNLGNGRFADVSFLSNADSDGDGRSAIPIDLNEDGRMDLLVRQAGGGTLLAFKNNFPQRNWLRVTLRGNASNSRGIGARLVATIGDRTLLRELYPINTYLSQAPAAIHFGLGDSESVDTLEIFWPSGIRQVLHSVEANRRIVIDEPRDSSAS